MAHGKVSEVIPAPSPVVFDLLHDYTRRPAILRFILGPLMERVFVWETKKRLRALKAYFGRR